MSDMFQSTHPHWVRHFTLYGCQPVIFVFQSTHPHWVRLIASVNGHTGVFVSIHAPALGATMDPASMFDNGTGFNPRTRTGCDKKNQCLEIKAKVFQSTHPHWVRLEITLFIGGC